MGEIRKIVDVERNLAIYTISGSILFDQLIDSVKRFYMSETIILNTIYELTHSDLSAMNMDQIEHVIVEVKKHAHLRKGGKTAFVSSNPLNFGLARMYEAYSRIKEHPIRHYVYNNLEDALYWVTAENSQERPAFR